MSGKLKEHLKEMKIASRNLLSCSLSVPKRDPKSYNMTWDMCKKKMIEIIGKLKTLKNDLFIDLEGDNTTDSDIIGIIGFGRDL